jgi:hypothetical protein
MKTEVIMQRQLFGKTVRQKSLDNFFSANDLVNAGNYYRITNGMSVFNLGNYLKNQSTIEFMDEVKSRYGDCIKITKGRKGETWVHPLLFIDIALAIDPKLKIEVYEWMFDNLIKFRNDSGDSYIEMSAAIFTRHQNIRTFKDYIKQVASLIKYSLKVDSWQTATEEQLKKRDLIHNSIKLLSKVLKDPDQIVRVAIDEHK